MNTFKISIKLGMALLFAVGVGSGCATTDNGSVQASTYNYYGVGYNDPWYHGGYYDDPDVIVTPPQPGNPPDQGLRPTHPIARPPAVSPPKPSIPSTPRPAPRRGGRR